MITIVLGAITLLFIAFALSRGLIERILRIKICSLCAAVATTWIGMLVLRISGIATSSTIIAILVGESIAGTMYKMSGKMKINPFIGLPTILFGTAIAYLIIEGEFEPASLLVIVPVAAIMYMMAGAGKKQDAKGRALLKKLENCCG